MSYKITDTGKYLVYTITSPEGKVYVGKSKASWRELWKRQRYGKGYEQHKELYADIKKFGWGNFKRECVADKLTPEEAAQLEADTIERLDSLYPNGYNKSSGGDKYYRVVYQTRSDKGARHKYVRTPEQIEQYKQHMRELRGTPVIQCTRDGEPVKIWQSISEAGEALNIDTGNIAHSARKERDTAGGYIWVYVDDYLFADALISAVIGE